MRSGTGTKSRLPAEVVRDTKSRIAFFGAPSFHDGSGSFCPKAVRVAETIPTATTRRPNERRSIESPSTCVPAHSSERRHACPMRERMTAVALDDLRHRAVKSLPASKGASHAPTLHVAGVFDGGRRVESDARLGAGQTTVQTRRA